MQLIPPTAERYGVRASKDSTVHKKLTDPKTNIRAGSSYLSDLIAMFPGQLELAIAAYNAGEGAVQRAGNKIPNYPETKNYVKTVMQLYNHLKPPSMMSWARRRPRSHGDDGRCHGPQQHGVRLDSGVHSHGRGPARAELTPHAPCVISRFVRRAAQPARRRLKNGSSCSFPFFFHFMNPCAGPHPMRPACLTLTSDQPIQIHDGSLHTGRSRPDSPNPPTRIRSPRTRSAPTSNTRSAWSRAARCPTWRRPEAGAAPHPVFDVAHGPGLRHRQRRQAGQERARGRRRAGPLPPARRPGRVRRAGAHGAGLRAALSADRRPGQLRQPRRRRRRGHALHRGAAGAITNLLLDEIDEGTVDFIPNYDGSTQEPVQLPARLPFALLNGASGIAVGLATEIPSHNLREMADACVALVKNPSSADDELFALMPGPTIRAAARSSAAADDIADAYRSGRGSLKVRARWKIEDLARGQWQLVVTELPPGVSTQKVLEEIEELTNPKVKAGKKALSAGPAAAQADRAVGAGRGARRVEQGRAGAPGVRAQDQPHRAAGADHHAAGAHQPRDLGADQPDDGRPGRPAGAEVAAPDAGEWIEFRQRTIERRSRHRLDKVLDRIHILEGRQLVLLNIDEVIAIIRACRRAEAGADRALQAERPAGRGHPRNPLAPAGAAGSDQDRAGAEGAARGAGEAGRDPRFSRPRCAADDQGDRGRHQAVRRRAPHADPGREEAPSPK
jgi:hypothetical protein